MKEAEYLKANGFEDIGYQRKYETMAFKVKGSQRCKSKDCGCGLPIVHLSEIDFAPYNTAGAATAGHLAMCLKAASQKQQTTKGDK